MKELTSCRMRCVTLLALSLAAISFWGGCDGQGAKAPTPKRPIDEGRAMKLIAEAMQDEGLELDEPKTARMETGKDIKLDAPLKGKTIAIVYLTSGDSESLGNDPIAQKKDQSSDDLVIRAGSGPDGGVHFVVLYASDYTYDDNIGEDHESTIITAENKLRRDARDFIVIARKQRW